LIDIPTAKELHDRGAIFIDTTAVDFWKNGQRKSDLNLVVFHLSA